MISRDRDGLETFLNSNVMWADWYTRFLLQTKVMHQYALNVFHQIIFKKRMPDRET